MPSLLKQIFETVKKTAAVDASNPAVWNIVGRGSDTLSGINVSPNSALGLSAYYACIKIVSEDIAKLPLFLFRRLKGKDKERATDHFLFPILHRTPNPEMSSMSFRETLTHFAMGWGNGYAEIVRNGRGSVAQLWPIHTSRVRVERESNGELVYIVPGTSSQTRLPSITI